MSTSRSSQRDLLLAFIAFMIALVLWQMQGLFWFTLPFRWFVTLIHELGHGTAAVLTGGSFLEFQVTDRGAGLAYTSGGWRWVIIQAGYVGTAVFGAGLLFLTHRTTQPGRVAIGVGIFIGILTLAYSGISLAKLSLVETALAGVAAVSGIFLLLTRETDEGRYAGIGLTGLAGLLLVQFAGEGNLLTIAVGLISALLLVWIGLRVQRDAVIMVLTFLAFLVGLQAITDSWTLFKIVSLPASMMPHNDASSMAREVGGTAGMWALIWMVMDIALFGTTAYYVLIHPARRGR
ncbi:MAG: M50 family metallopeptidase [Chloroflexi bacterium]|nr:M50 family metallopeptidase [Chloroflexota bacterium]